MKTISTCPAPAELWIDRPDAQQHIDRMLESGAISPEEAGQLVFFRDNGYLILPGAVPVEQVASLRHELSHIWQESEKYVVKLGKDMTMHPDGPVMPRKSRLFDFYVNSALCREMVFAPVLLRMLTLVFAEPPLVFQSMVFTWGSEQSIHKDTAFVVIDKPCTLAASWIALEDIEPGSGELMYYPGSHRDPLFLFDGEHLCWEAKRDGKGIHRRYSEFLDRQSAEKQCSLQTFPARAGDALIWHANLAHGGMPVTRQDKTRLSLVSHYCPVSNNPRYFSFFPEAYKCATGEAFYSSSRYDVRPDSHSPFPLRMR